MKLVSRLITGVDTGSIADELGIESGDILLEINGKTVTDVFDYEMAAADTRLDVLIEKANGEQWMLEIEKDQEEHLGLQFESGLMDVPKTCENNCIFCFMKQNPKNMRKSLYFQDDDYRLSFLHGNYITLTNMTDADVNRILEYRMSPMNISVHTTNKDLRVKMMRHPRAGLSLDYISKLVKGGTALALQIVLCKGYNDGEQLDKAIYELSKNVPRGTFCGDFSLSVVPAGLTKYREANGLLPLLPFEAKECEAVIDQVQRWQKRFLDEFGSRFVYAADEFYIKSGRGLPRYEEYEGFPQVENGVGMIALMKREFYEALEGFYSGINRRITVVTGIDARDFMREICGAVMVKFSGLEINVVDVKNDFFGESITVSGLLTGRDIFSQLKGRDLGDVLLLPGNCLRRGEDVLLDDVTVGGLSRGLGVKVQAVEPSAMGFLAGLGLTFKPVKTGLKKD